MAKYAAVCRFKRTKKSEYETGVAICNEAGVQSVQGIVGANGYPVTDVYIFTVCWILGCFQLPSDDLFKGEM